MPTTVLHLLEAPLWRRSFYACAPCLTTNDANDHEQEGLRVAKTLPEGWPLSTSYGEQYKRRMDAFQEGLWEHLDAVPTLAPQIREVVLGYLLELACQCGNVANIRLGRIALLALPRQWLLDTIERAAEPLLVLQDEWEYRRLLEVYQCLSPHLVHRLVARGLTSPNSEIREAAQNWPEPAE